MQIILHDFDASDLRDRGWALEVVLPEAEIHGFTTRRGLLRYIAKLPSRSGPKPLALVDIQHDDRQTRGRHLIQTIDRHPDLRAKVAVIAFTQFHSASRNAQLEQIGARGALNPLYVSAAIGDTEKREQLSLQLQRCASGASRTVDLGTPPSEEEDMKFLSAMTQLVPDLDNHMNPAEALEEALNILTVCRMVADGIEDADICARKVPGFEDRKDLKKLAEERLNQEALARIEAVHPGALSVDLGSVARHLARSKDRSVRRATTLEADRTRLYTRAEIDLLGRLTGILGEFTQDELVAVDPQQDGAFIPREDVPFLVEFLKLHPERRRSLRAPKPSTSQIAHVSEEVIGWMADRHDIPYEAMRDRITHAFICFEDLVHDGDAQEDPDGRTSFRETRIRD